MARPFPDSLEGFGYAFNKEGRLRKIDPATGQPGDEPFEFNISSNRSYNQKHYEALGEMLTEHIYKLLETTCGLKRCSVPRLGPPDQSSFMFASPDALTNPDKLLILIHGSGVVRAGQWARRLVINDGLESGSQIRAIERAKELGYAVLVLNTNDNRRHLVPGSDDPEQHASTVWHDFVRSAAAKHIAIMAHSYGGVCTVSLARTFLPEFRDRVFAIAFTDSVHSFNRRDQSDGLVQLFQQIGRNWVTSDKPLDTPMTVNPRHSPDVVRVSAGHKEHEMTSHSSHESVFRFIEHRYMSNLCPMKAHGDLVVATNDETCDAQIHEVKEHVQTKEEMDFKENNGVAQDALKNDWSAQDILKNDLPVQGVLKNDLPAQDVLKNDLPAQDENEPDKTEQNFSDMDLDSDIAPGTKKEPQTCGL